MEDKEKILFKAMKDAKKPVRPKGLAKIISCNKMRTKTESQRYKHDPND